ncbi:hypothetical protein J5Y04_31190 [Kitasatospora sp. RG8]|uniref:hypothetical protein n=1 Tax=Kitasatospora sp. RG8 TaxID=2820815 RepID=UPI001ADF6A28|nr:hypothetical protein [Kitasatospora sp. RG8]MBP0453973.1 hypothetical protein [Kitasatospora sp. RG8]
MPARTRTKRRSSLPSIKLSTLLPSLYNLRPDEVNTVVCPDCQTWQRIMGDKTRIIRDHYSTDLSGAELEAGQRDTRCPSARRIVEVDVTLAHWAKQVEEGSTQVAARRPTTVLKKVKTPQPPAVLHIAQPRPAVPAPTAAERADQWADVLLPVFISDALRRIPLHGARGPIIPLTLPAGARPIAQRPTADEVLAASPLRKERGPITEPEMLSA